MTLTINDTIMTSDQSPHTARHAASRNGWEVSWLHWVTGEDAKPPADHHGCGDYHPCPGLRRCSCEAAGYCLRGQCPACADRICNAAWAAIEENY